MKIRSATVVALSAIALAMAASPASAQLGMDKKRPQGAPQQLPQCATPIGTVAIEEPTRDWWTGLGLSNPEALIKLMAQRSNCLRVVARGAALAMRQQERDLGDSGELRRNSNIGKGQVVTADYTIIPDIVDSNGNAGGMNIGAAARAFGGTYGALLGGLSTKKSEAHALITLVNTRTTEQEYVAEGTAQKTDISLFGGGGGYNFSGAGGGYSNTDIGKVVTAAYIVAFNDLVGHMQQRMPGTASADAGISAYSVTGPVVMRATAAPSAKLVRNFAPGDLVYPTGQKNGIWWEV
ncbi:MAG: CsgG/HfaB family protein, partial [Caulobacteraceae bacterium]